MVRGAKRLSVKIHKQPGGETVVSAPLPDGRMFRVVGPFANATALEFQKMMLWVAARPTRPAMRAVPAQLNEQLTPTARRRR